MAMALTGCWRDTESPPTEKRAPATRTTKTTRTSAKKPPLKAPAIVDDKRLGTLPEGVGLPVGSRVADISVKTHLGQTVQLAELIKTGPLMLIFYRGGW